MARMGWFLGAVLAVGLLAGQAQAQVGVYAMFDAGHYSGLGVGSGTPANQSGGFTAVGATFGVYDDVLHAGPLGLGGDARLIWDNSGGSATGASNKITGFLTGVRVDANPLVLPFRPYAQLEIGAVGQNNGTSYDKQTSFGYQLQLGGDYTLIPHLGLRGEYGVGQLEASPNHTLQTFSAGLVLRL